MTNPIWASAINDPYDDDENEEDSTAYGLSEEDGEMHVVLTKGYARAIVGLSLVGLGTITYVAGKLIERLLDK